MTDETEMSLADAEELCAVPCAFSFERHLGMMPQSAVCHDRGLFFCSKKLKYVQEML